MIAENEVMKRTYNFKITRLGVLYTVIKIDKDIPFEKVHLVIDGRLAPVQEAIIGMNLDGIVEANPLKKMDNVDDEQFDYYKFEVFPEHYISNFLAIIALSFGAIWLLFYCYKHHGAIAQYIMGIYNKMNGK